MPVSRRHQGRGRGQDGADLQAAARDRRAVAAGRGAQFRFRLQGHRRAVHDRRAAGHDGHARHPRRRAAKERQDQSERARLHQLQRPRPDRERHRRRTEGDRRRDGGHVRQPRLRRLRGGGHARARRLRRLRAPCHPRGAAARPLPQGLRGQDAAREPRPAAPLASAPGSWRRRLPRSRNPLSFVG